MQLENATEGCSVKAVFRRQRTMLQISLEFIWKNQGTKSTEDTLPKPQLVAETGSLTLNAEWRNWDYFIQIENLEVRRVYESYWGAWVAQSLSVCLWLRSW